MTPRNPFRSSRLVFRAIEPDSDEDKKLYLAFHHDVEGYINSMLGPAVPQGKRHAEKMMGHMTKSMLGVVICLNEEGSEAYRTEQRMKKNSTAASSSKDDDSKGSDGDFNSKKEETFDFGDVTQLVSIGQIHLGSQFNATHRQATIGVDILPEFQRKGYGGEAIRWTLHWAFETGGLNRVGIEAFEWNTGARKLYENLGFKLEGIGRQMFFSHGRFQDDYQFGMLAEEWRQLKEQGKMDF
ncbi:acyl-CoA N-acyltransferase [Kockovaella imperatae]|uniref:Acyl-CoA N-acyltransferase n=1 Tax=Kockovaella imperatae TaxID=4999 RepID=A0A1Y1UQD9_9TREE|nr:acyl-CoA N-acyltransferase [Kockovaella imperatae]ORX39355.1 acyl-CoA N-acyltransferase [Kockovaella imperatae]